MIKNNEWFIKAEAKLTDLVDQLFDLESEHSEKYSGPFHLLETNTPSLEEKLSADKIYELKQRTTIQIQKIKIRKYERKIAALEKKIQRERINNE